MALVSMQHACRLHVGGLPAGMCTVSLPAETSHVYVRVSSLMCMYVDGVYFCHVRMFIGTLGF